MSSWPGRSATSTSRSRRRPGARARDLSEAIPASVGRGSGDRPLDHKEGEMNLRKLVAAGAGAVALAAGAAYAAIPDGSGVIHGCYDKVGGHLRLFDPQASKPKAC